MVRNNLKVLRVKNRLTQEQFAEKVGVCRRAMYAHIERGVRAGTAAFWDKVQTTFDLSDRETEKLKKNEK